MEFRILVEVFSPREQIHTQETYAFDQLHGTDMDTVGLLDGMDGDDVWVAAGSHRPVLALEACPPVQVGRHLLWQHFERPPAPISRSLSYPDLECSMLRLFRK